MSDKNTPEAPEAEAVSSAQVAADSSSETPAENSEAKGDDTPPDRLAIDSRSEHFNGDVLQRGIGIRFKGTQRTNVEEYSISESWVRVQAGKAVDRRGRPLTIKLTGPVEAWFEDLGEDAPVAKKD